MAFGVNEALKRAFPNQEDNGASNEGPPSLLKPFAIGAITSNKHIALPAATVSIPQGNMI
jgi:hypothetical protein